MEALFLAGRTWWQKPQEHPDEHLPLVGLHVGICLRLTSLGQVQLAELGWSTWRELMEQRRMSDLEVQRHLDLLLAQEHAAKLKGKLAEVEDALPVGDLACQPFYRWI